MTMKSVTCPVCGAQPTGELPYINSEFGFLGGEEDIFSDSRILVCDGCTYSFVHPFIANDLVTRFYREVYRGDKRSPYHGAGLCVPTNPSPRDVAQIVLGTAYVERVEHFLDVGAGAENSFGAVRGFHPACELYAVEEDDHAKGLLETRGVTVLKPQGTNLKLSVEFEGRFDLILMSHVLEHFGGPDVVKTLTNIAQLLKRGGALVVEVPNDDLTEFADVRINDAPHLSFFSQRSLQLAMERTGLRVLFVREVGAPRHEWYEANKNERPRAWWRNGRRWIKRLAVKGIIPHRLYCGLLALRWLRGPTKPLWRDPSFHYGQGRSCIRLVATTR